MYPIVQHEDFEDRDVEKVCHRHGVSVDQVKRWLKCSTADWKELIEDRVPDEQLQDSLAEFDYDSFESANQSLTAFENVMNFGMRHDYGLWHEWESVLEFVQMEDCLDAYRQ